jgi:hypothetical protein
LRRGVLDLQQRQDGQRHALEHDRHRHAELIYEAQLNEAQPGRLERVGETVHVLRPQLSGAGQRLVERGIDVGEVWLQGDAELEATDLQQRVQRAHRRRAAACLELGQRGPGGAGRPRQRGHRQSGTSTSGAYEGGGVHGPGRCRASRGRCRAGLGMG